MTAAELWEAYETCKRKDSDIPSFTDLVPFINDRQMQVPVSFFLRRFFDSWEKLESETTKWFIEALSDQEEYLGFLFSLLLNSLKSDSDIQAWKRAKVSLLNYLLTDHYEIVTEILLRISNHDSGYLTSEEASNQLGHLMTQNNTLKIRCFELMLRVACLSNDHLSKVLESPFIRAWINDFKCNDLMVSLNVIEMAAEVKVLNSNTNSWQSQRMG